MLSQMNQIGNSPQIPLSLLQGRVQDWLRAPSGVPEVLPERRAPAADRPLSQIPLYFLRRLAVDDRLRADLEADPVRTLARHGIHVAAHQIPAVVSLPGSQALHETLKAHSTDEDESKARFFIGWLGSLIGGDD
jgi:hypothetical protein